MRSVRGVCSCCTDKVAEEVEELRAEGVEVGEERRDFNNKAIFSQGLTSPDELIFFKILKYNFLA